MSKRTIKETIVYVKSVNDYLSLKKRSKFSHLADYWLINEATDVTVNGNLKLLRCLFTNERDRSFYGIFLYSDEPTVSSRPIFFNGDRKWLNEQISVSHSLNYEIQTLHIDVI